MKVLAKIDRFYFLLGTVLAVMAVITIFTLRTIFSSLEIAGEVNDELFLATTPRVNRNKLEEAITRYEDKEIIPLDVN